MSMCVCVFTLTHPYDARCRAVRHQIESYDNFMVKTLPHIIQESSEIVVENESDTHVFTFCNVSVQRPSVQEADGYDRDIMPHMARMRSVTYSSSVFVDVVHDIRRTLHTPDERRIYREVVLCKLPVMIGSIFCHTHNADYQHECRLDSGGYFIINGIEKALVAQEKLHTNFAYIFQVKQPSKYQLQCEIRSCHELKLRSTSTLYIYITTTKKGSVPDMVACLPFIDIPIPILAVFKLLNVADRESVVRLVLGDRDNHETRLLRSIIDNDVTSDLSTEELYDWLGREGTKEPTKERRLRYIDHIITNELVRVHAAPRVRVAHTRRRRQNCSLARTAPAHGSDAE